ncbi:MAG: ABC transporter permease [Planctomycetaceae bacterium]|nr:ABC transporter permease [Planctomycetaceae bacterium]
MMLAAATLCRRDLVRFFRQRSRLIGVLATPLIFWGLIGSGFNYMRYLYPGTLVQILLFTSIFSTISIIQDRQQGFLQGVLVAPVSRSAIVLGKVLGGTSIALTQGALFLLLGPVVGINPGPLGWLAALGVMAVISFGLTALGVLLAWRFDSVQGFHSIMNLLLMPMWLLSGAVFDPAKAIPWVRVVMVGNPLTYGVGALRRVLTGEGMGLGLGIGVSAAFAAVMFVLAASFARRR